MESQQDFSSSTELKHPFFEIICIGFMTFAWSIFILSTQNYKHVGWYEWLFYSRVGMSLLGLSLISIILIKKLSYLNIASWFLLVSVGIQASHGFFEGSTSVEFYNFIGIVFLLSCISYSGLLSNWLKYHLPFYLFFFLVPLMIKDSKYFTSIGTFIDSFSPMVAGLIIGIAIIKISSSKYEYILKYLQQKNEIIRLAYQVAHDIRSPVAALKIALEDVPYNKEEGELIKFSLIRIEDIANNLLTRYKENKKKDFNCFILDLENLIHEKKIIHHGDIKFDLTHQSNLANAKFSYSNLDLIRVISNLLNNAIEALGSSGLIKLNFILERENIVLSISDNGKGIPEAVLEEFKKKSFSYNKQNGHGLGLAHAEEFITNLGGSLKIDSIPDVGTRIKLIFPQHSFQQP